MPGARAVASDRLCSACGSAPTSRGFLRVVVACFAASPILRRVGSSFVRDPNINGNKFGNWSFIRRSALAKLCGAKQNCDPNDNDPR